LDAYDKRDPKIDRFVQQLQFSDTGVSGWISRKCNIAPSSHSVCKHYVGGATSSRKTDDRIYFRSPDIGCPRIDVSDNNWSFTLVLASMDIKVTFYPPTFMYCYITAKTVDYNMHFIPIATW
jgi:hypothetical protein